MLRQKSLRLKWHFWLVGLLFVIMQCDARAVNVSNTWTMPQEGLNVFYRFFRDRISWFEADAVCQFHHANLVTVDNSFQFDATRDLLRELDVNDIVWIGLMRPQNSDRFMWSSNSRPLVTDTGYWAESLPLMDAPLCAVIDPIRDYRWHALRCGGPETASFLCEMPVPSWADACNLKDMPNLTLQYMADTASIELIRNCQEEGLLRTMCRGKQDRQRASQDLICPRERLEAQRINDITNSHFKSLQIINSIPSDNNENNDIELLPMEVNYGPHYPEELQTEKNTVQRLIEQFNVDELMQADERSNMETVNSFYKIPGLIPKPVKKSTKKVLDYPKKSSDKQKYEHLEKDKKRLPVDMEEMMMGDQPLQGEPEFPEQFLNEDVSNEILEPLPHIKKTNIHKEDGLEKMEKEATAIKKNIELTKEMENKKIIMMGTTTTTETMTPITMEMGITATTTKFSSPITTTVFTTEQPSTNAPHTRPTEDHTQKHYQEIHTLFDKAETHSITTISPAIISHPMHPQQQHGNVLTEENQRPHLKESTDNSHFIPPMLMVKSHYVPPDSKHDHHHHHQQQHENKQMHLETTTEEHSETKENQASETMMETVTTPKVLDLQQQSTLKTLDSSMSSAGIVEREQQNSATAQEEEEEEEDLLATRKEGEDSSMNPITEQHTTETEQQRKNFKNLNFPYNQTTTTAKIVQSADATTAKTITTSSKEINKNNVGDNDEKEKLKSPQTSHTNAETTQATKLVVTTEKSLMYTTKKSYDLETVADTAEKEYSDTTTIEPIITQAPIQQQHVPTMEQKLTAIKIEENKKHLQKTTGTTKKTTEIITTPIAVLASLTQQSPTTLITEVQSLQQIEKHQATKKQLEEEDQQKDHVKKETVVKATEILVTSTALTKGQELQEEEEEDEAEEAATAITATTTTIYTPITSTSKTTTTTIKPFAITLPQNEIKSTETSFTTTTATNTPTDIVEENVSTTTIPTSTTFTPHTAISTIPIVTHHTTTEEKVESSTARIETTTQKSTPPETTRNFLKVTTEMPFKPNRRRSLTKPETVSYMKKILG